MACSAWAEPTVDPFITHMAQTVTFAFGGVGIAGVTSQGEKDYKTIFARPTARADFEKVFADGTPAAQCYALAALFQLDRAKYRKLADVLRASNKTVTMMQGCIMTSEQAKFVLTLIESGTYSRY